MKIKDFTYKDKKGDVSDRSLLVLNDSKTHISGIDFKKLKDEEMETKICGKCKKELSIDNFRTRKKNGKIILQPYCIECNIEKVKAITEEYEKEFKPFMKAYRTFIVESIVDEEK